MRYFKERTIKYQFVDLKIKGLSKGEYRSVASALGGMNFLLDSKTKDKDGLTLLNNLVEEDKEEKLLENQHLLKTPIVRNGKLATVGFTPEIWKTWE